MKQVVIGIFKLIGIDAKTKHIIHFARILFFQYFTKLGIRQILDYKSIPIIIISFNQLHYLKQLIDFLKRHKYSNIVIIDNNSTYKPLLDYLTEMETSVCLHRLNENMGHLVFWKSKELFEKYSKGYYVITDADIVPVENCPEDFVKHFKKILDKNFQVTKVGFSLKIDDIPDTNCNKQKVLDWENKYWTNVLPNGNYLADLDTTFALYRPNYNRENLNEFLKAIRACEPYIANHGGWYIDYSKLTDEQSYFLRTANNSSSWLTNDFGDLINPNFNKVYK